MDSMVRRNGWVHRKGGIATEYTCMFVFVGLRLQSVTNYPSNSSISLMVHIQSSQANDTRTGSKTETHTEMLQDGPACAKALTEVKKKFYIDL